MKLKTLVYILSRSVFLVALSFLISIIACRKVHYYPSRSMVISRSLDAQLKDSAMIYGKVSEAPFRDYAIPNATVWIEEVNVKTLSNDSGYFSLKVLPGKYTVKCYRNDPGEEFTVVRKDLAVSTNEKVEVRLLMGSRSE